MWLAVAIAAFGIGSRFPAVSERPATSGSGQDSPDLLEQPPNASRPDPNGSAGGLDAKPQGSRQVHLSEQEILSLGEKFRSSNPIDRRFAFSALLEGLTAENALQIREQLEHLGDKSAEYREFHYAWGAIGGVEAVLFGADTPGDDMAPTLAGWASTDQEAARAWLEALDMEADPRFDSLLVDRKIPAEALRNHLMGGLVAGMASTDPAAASQLVHDLVASGNEAAYGMIHRVVGTVLRSSTPTEAAAWAERMSDERLRRRSMEHVAAVYASRDFEGARDWALTLADRPDGAGVVSLVGSRMARRDPPSAMAWLDDLPPGDGQSAGAHRVMREWTDRDPTAASDYLASMIESPARDSAITGLTQRLAQEDPQSAVTWAETITSDSRRQRSLIEAGRAWNREDPAAAAEWLGTTDLPEDTRQAILAPATKR